MNALTFPKIQISPNSLGNTDPYPKVHANGDRCFSGFVYVDEQTKIRELMARRMTNDEIDRALECGTQNFTRPCPECQGRKFLDRYAGGRNKTWAAWKHRNELTEAVTTLCEWEPTKRDPALLIYGTDNLTTNTGNGKTHAVMAQAVFFIRLGKHIRYVNAADIIDRRFERSPVDELGDYTGLLIVDDLGSEPATQGSRDMLDRLLDSRWRNFRPSIAVTKLGQYTVSKTYPRFGSRMARGSRILWQADPYL